MHRTALLEPICTTDCNDDDDELQNMDSIEVKCFF